MVSPVSRVLRSIPRPLRRGFKAFLFAVALPGLLLAAPGGKAGNGGPRPRLTPPVDRAITLPEAIELVLATHPSVAAPAHAVSAADHGLKAAEALKLPRISLQNILKESDNYKRYQQLGPIGPLLSDINNDSAMISGAVIEVPVYVGDRIAILPRLAEKKKSAQQQLRRKILQDTVLEVTGLYMDVLVAEKQLKLERERIARKELDLEAAREKAAGDLLAESRLTGLELELDELHQQQLDWTNQLDEAQQHLAELVGLPPGNPVKLDPELEMRDVEGPVTDMFRVARAENPEIRLLEIALSCSGEEMGLAASDEKPQVNFRADWFWDRPWERPQNADSVWTVALMSTWNLFDGGRVDQEKKQARDKMREAKANLAAGLQQVDLQIRQAYSNLTASRKLMDGLERSVGLARRTLQTVTEKYQVNVLPRAELLEARTNLMRATVNRDRVSAAVLKTRALLFRLMGRLEPSIFQAGPAAPLAEPGTHGLAEHAMARGER